MYDSERTIAIWDFSTYPIGISVWSHCIMLTSVQDTFYLSLIFCIPYFSVVFEKKRPKQGGWEFHTHPVQGYPLFHPGLEVFGTLASLTICDQYLGCLSGVETSMLFFWSQSMRTTGRTVYLPMNGGFYGKWTVKCTSPMERLGFVLQDMGPFWMKRCVTWCRANERGSLYKDGLMSWGLFGIVWAFPMEI